VTSASFSPDGSRLATCGAGDGIRVWNVDTGEPMFHIPERDGGSFLGAMFVADEHHLLTIQGQILATFKLGHAGTAFDGKHHSPSRDSGFCGSTDGTDMATYDNETGIDLWKISKTP
jgi:WD40 repeat protein